MWRFCSSDAIKCSVLHCIALQTEKTYKIQRIKNNSHITYKYITTLQLMDAVLLYGESRNVISSKYMCNYFTDSITFMYKIFAIDCNNHFWWLTFTKSNYTISFVGLWKRSREVADDHTIILVFMENMS